MVHKSRILMPGFIKRILGETQIYKSIGDTYVKLRLILDILVPSLMPILVVSQVSRSVIA